MVPPSMRSLQHCTYLDHPVNRHQAVKRVSLIIVDLLLALCPPNIDPSSLSVMVAFAVGGLLGDTIFHLLPEIFLGETSPDHARFVLVDPNKNLLLGVAIIVGFVTFTLMDKSLRIATGGDAGHEHGHGHNDKAEEVQIKKEEDTKAVTTGREGLPNGEVKARRIVTETVVKPKIYSDLDTLKLSSAALKSLKNVPEPHRSNRWLSEVLEKDEDSGVTQIAIWKSYEAAFRGNSDIVLLEATVLIQAASKGF